MTHPAADMNDQRAIYRLWSRVYDPVYIGFFSRAQKTSARLAKEAGSKILEVGFGTGLMLRYFDKSSTIYGVDLSNAMLKVAARKIADDQKNDVAGLCVMDATRLAFPDESFDVVLFPFVIAIVHDPEAALDEAFRVLKPGGRIVIANRFGAENGLQAKIERFFAPLAARIGWSVDFKISRVARWVAQKGGIVLDPLRFNGYFKVIMLQKALDA
ncbi:MAG: class I SAM-dependent methyltransferase [Pseudomonadota bacterium]